MPAEVHREDYTDRLLTPYELAVLLGLGRTHTYNLLISGQLPSVRIGRLRRIRRSDLDAFIESHLERHRV